MRRNARAARAATLAIGPALALELASRFAAQATDTPQAGNSQHVLKAEADGPDATDRENPALASPVGGPMGVGQAAAAAPTASTERGSWTCSKCGFRGFWYGGPHCA